MPKNLNFFFIWPSFTQVTTGTASQILKTESQERGLLPQGIIRHNSMMLFSYFNSAFKIYISLVINYLSHFYLYGSFCSFYLIQNFITLWHPEHLTRCSLIVMMRTQAKMCSNLLLAHAILFPLMSFKV